jgi:hypothetical protein
MEVIMRNNASLRLCVLILSILFITTISNASGNPNIDLRQATEELSCGPISFSPPQGYWYYPPLLYANNKDNFLFTFYKTKKEAIEAPEGVKNPVINLKVFPNTFKNADAYYQALSEMRRAYSTEAEKKSYTKNLPKDMELLFRSAKNWSCREEVNRGYPDLISMECILLNRNGVWIACIGTDEKKILDMAPMLLSIMNSVTFKLKLE